MCMWMSRINFCLIFIQMPYFILNCDVINNPFPAIFAFQSYFTILAFVWHNVGYFKTDFLSEN